MTSKSDKIILLEPAGAPGEPHVREGNRVMLQVLDAANRTIANFATDRPRWALDRIFETRSPEGHTFATREIIPVQPA